MFRGLSLLTLLCVSAVEFPGFAGFHTLAKNWSRGAI